MTRNHLHGLSLFITALAIGAPATTLAATAAGGAIPVVSLDALIQGPARPTGIHDANDGSGRLFVLTKNGAIEIFDGTQMLSQPFLDIDDRVNSSGVERGLHGLAFDPDYASNGFFYVMYTDLSSDSVLARYSVSANPNVADPVSETILMQVDQPDQFHNISQLQFGPDGYLYIGAGDGGFIGDPDNRAQNLGVLLGKILRIDVHGAAPYAIPPDNPFLSVPGARGEIWAYGVRNPWRFSFDRETGDMYMGDVGQWTWEEVNFQPGESTGGENYGWRLMEGAHCYDPPSNCEIPSLTMPIAEYEHVGSQCAVVGGYVYRGQRFPRFYGTYFYADWCVGRIWGAREVSGVWDTVEVLDSNLAPSTFGEDADGELYVADDNNGMLYRLIDPQPFCDLRMSQPAYADGEAITIETLRLVNLGKTNVAGRLQLVLVPPGGGLIPLIDIGSDGSLLIPGGVDFATGALPLFTVGPATPAGNFTIACRLSDPGSGADHYIDANFFAVE